MRQLVLGGVEGLVGRQEKQALKELLRGRQGEEAGCC